ncbi:DUF1129 family protein [Xylocopilactobacillus apicola]|uniref:Membrane protein n=1 Tax=Xylocopilactobacillus apicola TaxID=2932184 RepID=A0AAU9CY77_9LACO|nr:DUF1129 family protein [Xylocopilactobacillus apicola]BDR58994.1 membrane protein [Xylocopilactobacillus apicola]
MSDKKEKVIEQEAPKHSQDELTKKNSDYVFQLRKVLVNEENYSEQEADEYVESILGEIIEAQRKGMPANRLYGTPRKKASDHIKGEKSKPASKFSILWLDNSVIFAFLLSAMTCLVLLTSKTKSASSASGIVTVILMSAEFGCPWAYFTRWMSQPKEERASWLKLIGVIILGFLGLLVVTGIAAIIPPAFNPTFDAFIYLVLAALLFGAHYYLKRKYHIVGTIF